MSESEKEASIKRFRSFAAEKLDEIADHLPGIPLVTLIIRFDGHPGRDILMTTDTFDGIEALIARRQSPEPGSFDIPADEQNSEGLL